MRTVLLVYMSQVTSSPTQTYKLAPAQPNTPKILTANTWSVKLKNKASLSVLGAEIFKHTGCWLADVLAIRDTQQWRTLTKHRLGDHSRAIEKGSHRLPTAVEAKADLVAMRQAGNREALSPTLQKNLLTEMKHYNNINIPLLIPYFRESYLLWPYVAMDCSCQ